MQTIMKANRTWLFAAILLFNLVGTSAFAVKWGSAEEFQTDRFPDEWIQPLTGRNLNVQERQIVDKIKKIYDRGSTFSHHLLSRWMLLRYPFDLLIFASLEYLQSKSGYLENGREAAAEVLVLAAIRSHGGQGLLQMLFSGHGELEQAARNQLRAHLGGIIGFLREILSGGAPRVFRELEPEIKAILISIILNSSSGVSWTSTGLLETLGSWSEMRELVREDFPTHPVARKAARRVGKNVFTSTISLCALLLTHFEK